MAANGHTTIHQLVDEAASLHVAESTSVSRERSYPPGTDIDYLLGLIRNQRGTGQVIVDISQGSICNIRFIEKQRIP